jgi:hypothetical protein
VARGVVNLSRSLRPGSAFRRGRVFDCRAAAEATTRTCPAAHAPSLISKHVDDIRDVVYPNSFAGDEFEALIHREAPEAGQRPAGSWQPLCQPQSRAREVASRLSHIPLDVARRAVQ